MILELDAIEKAFGGTPVLRGVGFGVERGHVHALLGENGAGKSTLMRILLGLERADGGTMRLAGAPYAPSGPAAARRAGVVMVPQERTLCAHLTVTENIVLGLERHLVRRAEERALADEVLALVAGPGRIDATARAGDLSVADQQLVEIARALAAGPAKILVLDEPTSSLGKEDASRLFERVRAMKETGLAVVLVTHFLGDVRDHADRYTVLRDGKVQGEGDPREASPERIVREMIGRELEATMREEHAPSEPGEILLDVKDLGGRDKPRRASFTLRRGEILGIAGLVGSGRTELLRAVLGLDAVRAGTVRVTAPKGMGLLSEDRGGEGLMLAASIADNVTLSPRGPSVVRPADVRAEGTKWIAELHVKASSADQPVLELSGGNQQKVQVARLLREDFDVLLVDEPTRGIDVASKAQILALLRSLAGRGKGIVLVSSQLDELVGTCDRIAILRGGELEEARPASAFTEESLLLGAAT